jgi:3'-5' exoribonuclease
MTTENPGKDSNPGSEERVRKVFVKDLRDKERLRTVFRVTRKARVNARSGKSFLTLTFTDKTGHVDGRVFEKVDELEPTFLVGDYVLLSGQVTTFHGKLQVVADSLERLDPGPISEADFTPSEEPAPQASETAPARREERREERRSERREEPHEERAEQAPAGEEGRRAQAGIRELVERVGDGHVRALLQAFLDDTQLAEALRAAPYAKGGPRAYRGGLADHLHSTMRLVHRVAEHYPAADRDLLVAGAFLQGIMRAKETAAEKGSPLTDEGRLVGAAVMAAQALREKARTLPDFPPLLESHLTHLVLAQEDVRQPGSGRPALTVEAELLRTLVAMDTRLSGWLEAMARDSHDTWTEPLRGDGRSLWKGPAPTQRGKSPVESRRARREERKKQKGAPGQGATGPRKERPAGEPREESAPQSEARPPRQLPKELAFKPFSALTASEPATPQAPADDAAATPSAEQGPAEG